MGSLGYAKAIEEATYGENGEYRIMEKTGLSVLISGVLLVLLQRSLLDTMMKISVRFMRDLKNWMIVRSFIRTYNQEKLIDDCQFGDTIVFVLADLATDIDPTWVPQKRRV